MDPTSGRKPMKGFIGLHIGKLSRVTLAEGTGYITLGPPMGKMIDSVTGCYGAHSAS
jgi:hypothetical protein